MNPSKSPSEQFAVADRPTVKSCCVKKSISIYQC